MTLARLLTATFLTSVALTGAAAAQDAAVRPNELFKHGAAHGSAASIVDAAANPARPPIVEGLGPVDMVISTSEPNAQRYFEQGVALMWGFNHAEAVRAFRAAQEIDPECAMCFWGEAYAFGQNLNDVMHDNAVAPAWTAIERARALADGTSPLEQALIEALATRYAPEGEGDRLALNQAFADAMRRVAEQFPDNANVLAIAADALMNLQPWDYWEADGVTPKGGGGEIVSLLERALEIDPDNLAALHLYIHATEASSDPAVAEAAADRLRGMAPAAGHLTHMPAHVYVRVGRYADSIAVNHEAIAADESFLAQVGTQASPIYRYGYYPHNVHFLLVSAQMAGLGDEVIAAAQKLREVLSPEVSKELGWVQAIETAPYTAHAQFSDPGTILALEDPGDELPFVKGFWHYARGVAHAMEGEAEAAMKEAEAIERIAVTPDVEGLANAGVPGTALLTIAANVVRARAAQSEGDLASARSALEEAIALEDSIPYMEPAYWYYPVRQTLAAVQLEAGDAEGAVETFEAALKAMPRNGWALWGLAEAHRAAGDEAEAAKVEGELDKAWLGGRELLELRRL